MFRKTTKEEQLDLFKSPSMTLSRRAEAVYNNPEGWHNQFFKLVTSQIDEEVFRPLFKDVNNGAPNASLRILAAIAVLKEGFGCSDEQMFEKCDFDLLTRAALGLRNIDDICPSLDTYYMFRRRLFAYMESNGEDLMEKCFEKVTAKQVKIIGVSGLVGTIQGSGFPIDQAEVLFEQCYTQCVQRELVKNDVTCIQPLGNRYNYMQMPLGGFPTKLDASAHFDFSQFAHTIDYYFSHCDSEREVYFYHPDHLGSASWITDTNGYPVQHLQYLPFGEPFVNQRATNYNERYTFTGKERDSETGYSYFGARYYDSDLSGLFLSVDPMADKYPSISLNSAHRSALRGPQDLVPYCAWNPLKLVDPDGRELMDIEDWYKNGEGDILWDENVKGPDDLPDNCTYLGSDGIGVNEEGQVTRVYNSDGTIDIIPQMLPQVDITEKGNRKSAEVAAKIPLTLSVALYDGPELGPADAFAILGSLGLSLYATALWVMEEVSTPTEGKPNIQQYEEHTRGARNSTWDKHTQKRPGQVTGQQRNDNRGNKNRKFHPQPNPNRKKK